MRTFHLAYAFICAFFGLTLASNASTQPQGYPDYSNLTVAVVRAPPVNWPLPLMNKNWTNVQFDLKATVDKAVDLIEQAAQNEANLIVFPELWFPG